MLPTFTRMICHTVFLALLCAGTTAAWDRGTAAYEDGPGAVIQPLMPDSTHVLPPENDGPTLRLKISNTRREVVRGALLYVGVTDFTGRGVQDFERRLDLPSGADIEIDLKVDSLAGLQGFYDVRALLFNRGREYGGHEFTFGYDVDRIDTPPYREPDFDSFWQATGDTLNSLPLEQTVERDSVLSSPEVDVFRISYRSLHGVRVHGWYTTPRRGSGPYAAILVLPGYSSGRVSPPTGISNRGWAALAIQVRGYGVDQESYPEENSRYMTLGIESPETYVFREIVCHCLRGLDFLAGRPEVDSERLGVIGGSQGGGLALLTAGLDRRVRVVSAGVPFLTNFPLSLGMTGAPYREIVRYIRDNPERRESALRTVSYVDALNFVERIQAPTLISVGLFDRTCPAPSIYGAFLRLGAERKEIRLYPYLDHFEVHSRHADAERQWLLEHLSPLRTGP